MDAKNQTVRGYIDSLALTDKYLATLRHDMEARGLWDKTAVITSSDHPFRQSETFDGKSDPHVPFMLKLAGHAAPASYQNPFHTILTSGLVTSILNGSVATTPDVLAWLNRHRSESEAVLSPSTTPEDPSKGPEQK
jgi:arylsulfatase A-like enzyme